MVMAEGYVLEIREVRPEELIDEEALEAQTYRPFLAPWEHDSPYRDFEVARARLARALAQEPGKPLNRKPFVLETPHGLGVLFRALPDKVEILLCRNSGGRWILQDNAIVALSKEEYQRSRILLDRIVVNPPGWL